MRGRIRSVGGHGVELGSAWELCATAPDAFADPAALAAASVTWSPAPVPSTVASALRSSGAFSLDGPARRFDAEDFWYRTRFRCAPAEADEILVLACDGLATVADVYLNGALLFSSEDMFVAHEHRIDALLSERGERAESGESDNELAIRFRSLDALLAARRPRPRWRAPMIENQQLRWFRTTLLGRTPGWSPPAAPVGPWRPIRLERRRTIDVSNVRLRATVAGGTGIVEVACVVRALHEASGERELGVEIELEHGAAKHRVSLQHDGQRWVGRLEIPEVEVWWPFTHGKPSLYSARLRVSAERAVDVELGAVGFRTLDLDREQDGFALRVNGVRVFCRGACWTPLDPVSLQATSEAIDAAVEQVRDAGMNMIRVGGTMVYEDDAFFDACDRAGILVWQDFMFANMDYPEGDPAFDARVKLEASQLLARIQGRPCVAVLCGNSEGEQQAAMWGAPRELWSPALFHQTLAGLARELCPDVAYWPSSAHGGSFPHQPTAGTTSYYGVGAYLRPLEDARRSEVRFASECLAFANVPEPSGVAAMPGGPSSRVHHPSWKSRTPRDLGAGWDFDDVRDHYLSSLFGVDALRLRYADHDRYLALSRVVTGEVMASTFAEWRRLRSRTSGGLVWFLRDLWPGAGWGLIDADGTPKAPYWFLRRALQPVAVSISDEGQSGVYVHVINDGPSRIEAKLEVTLHLHGEVRVGGGAVDLDIAPHDAIELAAGSLFDGFFDTSYAYRFGPPAHDLVVAVLRDRAADTVLAEATYLPLGHARSREADLGLTAEATPAGAGARGSDAYDLVLRTRRFAQWVAIEVDGFVPSDNHVHVLPGGERRLVLTRASAKGALRGNVVALNAESPTKIGVR